MPFPARRGSACRASNGVVPALWGAKPYYWSMLCPHLQHAALTLRGGEEGTRRGAAGASPNRRLPAPSLAACRPPPARDVLQRQERGQPLRQQPPAEQEAPQPLHRHPPQGGRRGRRPQGGEQPRAPGVPDPGVPILGAPILGAPVPPTPCSVPDALPCLPAHQGPHLPQEQEPAGAPLEGMRQLGAAAGLSPSDLPVPEHPQVRVLGFWGGAGGGRVPGREIQREILKGFCVAQPWESSHGEIWGWENVLVWCPPRCQTELPSGGTLAPAAPPATAPRPTAGSVACPAPCLAELPDPKSP